MTVENRSYVSNYYQTYIWQGLSILFNLISMFIVIPFISEEKTIFGIYSVCISTSIFLNYADIGFVSAAIKYAGESYARGEREDELRYYGLAGFILFILITVIALVYVLLAMKPSLLINGIENSEYLHVATSLLIVQAIFSYNNVLQRFVTSVFQVRIEQYIHQRVNILANIIKIVSVFYFFTSDHYDIVGYFIFIKLVELLALIVSIIIIRMKYHIFFTSYLKVFRYNKEIYFKTKTLAYSSLFVTVMWIVFYEMDVIVIGHYYGANLVAIYALAFTLIKFLRSITSVLYSPFKSRYNHFIGLGEPDKLRDLLKKVIMLTMPIIVLTVLSVVILSKPIVTTWAGSDYQSSGFIFAFLASSYLFSFIRIPGANLLVALEKVKDMYFINGLMVILFWGGVIATSEYYGIRSFAIFKLVAGVFAAAYYFNVLTKYLNYGILEFLNDTVVRMVIPITVQITFLFGVFNFIPAENSVVNFLVVITTGGIATLFGLITLYFTSRYYRETTNRYFHRILVTQ